jgi:hypothetical protein
LSVRISIDGDKIVAKMFSAWETGLEMLSSQILADCNRYCKRDSGVLIMSSLVHSDLKHGKLVWQTPYAARQYYEIETAYTDRNPDASWRWCEVARSRHEAKWGKQAAAIVRYYK